MVPDAEEVYELMLDVMEGLMKNSMKNVKNTTGSHVCNL